jgi:hypothetical protein
MPTLGWILEESEERRWEKQSLTISLDEPLPQFPCNQCGAQFFSSEELRRHLGLNHPLGLPALYIHGRPLQKEMEIRNLLKEDDLELFQCSLCRVRIDRGSWQDLTVSQFRTQFVQAKNEIWDVQLMHNRPLDNAQATDKYLIRFRIPDPHQLDIVDDHFRQTLVVDEPSHADLERFHNRLSVDAAARDYAGALGDYVLGILFKEGRNRKTGSTFQEFTDKMRTALEILRHFNRPIALTVSSSIRFNLNDFHDSNTITDPALATALKFFRNKTQLNSASLSVIALPPPSLTYMVCPIDRMTHQLLSACSNLARFGALTLAQLDDLWQFGTISPISAQDLVKLHVICAESYIHLGQMSRARQHIHAIQFDSSFRGWASDCIEDIFTNGT